MPKQIRFSTKPGITGVIMSSVLIVSFFLPRIWPENPTVNSINTILIVVTIVLGAKLIKQTSELYGEYLWNNKIFPLLMTVPVFNMLIAAAQFVVKDAKFMLHPVFLTLLVISSLPAFCCYYFTAMWVNFKRDRRLYITTAVVDAVGLLYILIRLSDKVIIPALSLQGNEISLMIDKLASLSPWFSLVIYIISFANFIICAKIFSEQEISE